ncbi:MAG: hypothetical protein HY815_08115 [Candidatus Riflebacteria bacterium]|nr:hypothetical protein [Candidatus Riflebacteria bacterium]
MADDQSNYGDARRRVVDSDSTNLLRDLRTLRDSPPRENIDAASSGPSHQGPSPGASPMRLVAVLGLVVAVVVGIGYQADLLSPSKPVGSPGSSTSPAPVTSPSTAPAATGLSATTGSASVATSPWAVPPVSSPRHRFGKLEEAVSIGLRVALIQWLVEYYDPRAPAGLRFCTRELADTIPCTTGPAVLFGRPLARPVDVFSLAMDSLAERPGPSGGSGPREDMLSTLALLNTADPASSLERPLGDLMAADAPSAVQRLSAGRPKEPGPLLVLALARGLAGEEPSAVDAELMAALSGSTETMPMVIAAHLEVLRGHKDRATPLLGQVADKGTSAPELFLAAGLAQRTGQTALVTKLLEKIPFEGPGGVGAACFLGHQADRSGHSQRARELYDKVVKARPADKALLASALIQRYLLSQATSSEAIEEDLRLAEELDPANPGLVLAQARTAVKRSSYADARAYWEQLLVRTGPSEEVLKGLARSCADLKDLSSTRQSASLLGLLLDHGLVPPGPPERLVTGTLATLNERLKPREIRTPEFR